MATPVRRTALRVIISGLALASVAGACSSPASSPSAAIPSVSPGLVASPSAASPSASPSAVASPSAAASTGPAPATFALTAAGDTNVTGTWTSSYGITCLNPTFSGRDIIFFAASPDAKAVVLITLAPGSIGVSERAGSGTGYTDREFKGTGVTSFDATKGATFDSDLAIVPSSGQKPGTLGTIKHVTGSVDCAGQTAGTSTIVLSGASAEGAINGPFSIFQVTCNVSAAYGNSVSVSGIITSGTSPTAMIVSLSPSRSGVYTYLQTGSGLHSYTIAPAGSVSMSADRAHVDADFVETLATGATATPHTIHLAGDVVCGSFKTY